MGSVESTPAPSSEINTHASLTCGDGVFINQIEWPVNKSYYLCNIDLKMTPNTNCFKQANHSIGINLVGSESGFYRYETYADKKERRVVGIKLWSNDSKESVYELFCDGWSSSNSMVISSATTSIGYVATGIEFEGDEAGFLRDFRLINFASANQAKSRGKIRRIVKRG